MKITRKKDNMVFYIGVGNTTKMGTMVYIENREGFYDEVLYNPNCTYNEIIKDIKEYIEKV